MILFFFMQCIQIWPFSWKNQACVCLNIYVMNCRHTFCIYILQGKCRLNSCLKTNYRWSWPFAQDFPWQSCIAGSCTGRNSVLDLSHFLNFCWQLWMMVRTVFQRAQKILWKFAEMSTEALSQTPLPKSTGESPVEMSTDILKLSNIMATLL